LSHTIIPLSLSIFFRMPDTSLPSQHVLLSACEELPLSVFQASLSGHPSPLLPSALLPPIQDNTPLPPAVSSYTQAGPALYRIPSSGRVQSEDRSAVSES